MSSGVGEVTGRLENEQRKRILMKYGNSCYFGTLKDYSLNRTTDLFIISLRKNCFIYILAVANLVL